MPVLHWIESCAGLFRRSAETSPPRHASPRHSLSLPRLLCGKYLRRTVWPSFRRPAPPAHSDPWSVLLSAAILPAIPAGFPLEKVCSDVRPLRVGIGHRISHPLQINSSPDVEVPA